MLEEKGQGGGGSHVERETMENGFREKSGLVEIYGRMRA